MPDVKARLLIVDDAPAIRMVLSQILAQNEYTTRSAADGFSALAEIRREVPDMLVTDLNMPGMSGYELLNVVRRRFPSIRAIAMSDAFSGDKVPLRVLADAFFEKGTGFGVLLRILKSLPQPDRIAQQPTVGPTPVWISRYERNAAGEGFAFIECSDCLGTFPRFFNGTINLEGETDCLYCGTPVRYAVCRTNDQPYSWQSERKHSSQTPALQVALEPHL